MSARTVAVVGGGLAGITAALRLADAGCPVTLHEAKPKLGGLTHSFRRALGEQSLCVDNGQHVFLRCCTSYLALLDRLGVRDQVTLQDRLDVTVLSEAYDGVGRLRRSGLPAPLHLGAALARYRWLSPLERARVVPAALALGGVDRTAAETDARSFGAWLSAHGQSPRAVEAVWDLIGVATLNAPAERASLALAATVFQLGLLSEAGAADIGWSRVPLQQLHGDAAAKALADAGVDVRLGSKVASLDELQADDVVVATPAPEAEALVSGTLPDGLEPGWSERLGSAPIINLHLVYDRPVLEEPFVAAVDSPLQWVFDRTAHSGLSDGQYLAVSLSAAEHLVDLPVATLRERFVPRVEALLPRARGAELRDFFVTRERHATFRPVPGSGRFRPETRTKSAHVYLAGAWTATGWPATMEGAVRSGDAAADAVLEQSMEVGAA
ncbi:hydroxysqualene dehydroxylase HpnE [Nocardioides sp. KR10-350]|uniref:hydroxysqualene dehydroxylase HpnE n=1 Tax=Nocardioides cheoyonin TaxID=3156615 RepID=UPI0032B41F56